MNDHITRVSYLKAAECSLFDDTILLPQCFEVDHEGLQRFVNLRQACVLALHEAQSDPFLETQEVFRRNRRPPMRSFG